MIYFPILDLLNISPLERLNKAEGLSIAVSDLEYTLFHKYKMDYYRLKSRFGFFFFLFIGISSSSLLV